MSGSKESCCSDQDNWEHDRFKDVLYSQSGYVYTVYLCTCKKCGEVIEEGTWIE